MKKCRNCGAEVKDNALWCPECGADVGNLSAQAQPIEDVEPDVIVAEPVQQPMPAQPVAQGAFCPHCGKPVVAGGSFCPSCGAALAGGQPQRVMVIEKQVEREEPRERRRPRRPLIIHKEETNTLGIVSFVLTMVGLFGFLFTSWLGFGLLFIFLAPLTLLLSFIALFKKPRGFAIAAFIISLLECLGMLVTIIFFGAIISAMFS